MKCKIVLLTVALSEAEYKKLSQKKAFTPDGTMNNVIRSLLGLQPRAMGHLQADAAFLTESEYLQK